MLTGMRMRPRARSRLRLRARTRACVRACFGKIREHFSCFLIKSLILLRFPGSRRPQTGLKRGSLWLTALYINGLEITIIFHYRKHAYLRRDCVAHRIVLGGGRLGAGAGAREHWGLSWGSRRGSRAWAGICGARPGVGRGRCGPAAGSGARATP